MSGTDSSTELGLSRKRELDPCRGPSRSSHGRRACQSLPLSGNAPAVTGPDYTLKMTRELHNDDVGTYLATTATGSEYLLDLTAGTVQRQMAATVPLVDFLDAGFSRLRRDGVVLELLLVESCAIGVLARYWIQVRDDNVPTLRSTSPVVRIVSLAGS